MTIGVGEETNGLYYLLQKPTLAIISEPSSQFFPCFPFLASIKNVTTDIWHYRLGHLSYSRFKMIHISNPKISCNFNNTCTVCPLAKQKFIPFPVSSSTSNKNFDLIHCDIWRPFSISSKNDCHFFLTNVDDFSRYTLIHLMQSKGQTRTYIQSFFHLIETHFNSKIKVLRSDNGPKFNMAEFYSNKGVLHQLSCVESPQQNAKVERKHQHHLLNVARSLRFQANLPFSFWIDCVTTTAYFINRIPTPLLSNKSPYEMLFSKPPIYSHLKVFGCLCSTSTLSRHRNKLEPRAKPCLFLGYPSRYKGYILLDLVTKLVFVSRDVIFHESTFPYFHDLNNPTSNGIFQSFISSSSNNPVLPMFIHDTYPNHSNSHDLSPSDIYHSMMCHFKHLNLYLKHHLNLYLRHHLNLYLKHHLNLYLKHHLTLHLNLNLLLQIMHIPLILPLNLSS